MGMMQELSIRFDNIIHHAISIWLVVVVITVICASTVWAVKMWRDWCRTYVNLKDDDER